MATATVHFDGTREEAKTLLRRFVRVLAGTEADPWNVAQGLQLRMGTALLSKIREAFIVKSRGGTGEDGIKWTPLKRETIAQRRTTRAERKALGITGKRVRGLLTPAQDKQWRSIFASQRNWLMARFGLSEGAASARAAQTAWARLKEQGAKTKLDVLGGRQVDILRDTGELLRSLSPGVESGGADGQILRVPGGRVIVGTNKKPWHQDGVPGKLPARPLWPADGNLPESWWEALLGTLNRGMVRALVLILESRRAA